MADERDEVAGVGIPPRLRMHLGDQRANRVDDTESTPLCAFLHGRGDPVRREDADLAGRHLVLILDENRTELLEAPDNVLVVDDLMPHVDGWPVLLEQPLDDLDRAIHSGTERARRGEQYALAHPTASRLLSARRAS